MCVFVFMYVCGLVFNLFFYLNPLFFFLIYVCINRVIFSSCFQVWVKLSVTEPDGKTRLIRRKVTIKHIGVNPRSLDAIDETPVECSEIDVDESNPFDERFNSKVRNIPIELMC